MRRLIAILVVALLAAPGLWWRSPPPPPPAIDRPVPAREWDLVLEPLALAGRSAGQADVVEAWALRSGYPGFGGYSSLARLGDGRLLAASDTGRMLAFAPPGAPPGPARMGPFAGRWEPNKFLVDIEAVTRDPVSGRIWVAYEGSNAIERFEPGLTDGKRLRPIAMHGWPGNSGPETLLRLADGRFLAISEGRAGWRGAAHPALLFPSDPVEGAEPIGFAFDAPDGFRPVDAAQLPDGRVLVLLRRFDWLPPGFKTRVLVADPAEIREGGTWHGQPIAAIQAPSPAENYEGLAVEPDTGGAVRLWLISDDNRSVFQRTQLLALRWHPDNKKARGNPARPAN